MNTYIVTITSKNQITLPAKLVRKYGWDKGRTLELINKGDKIELTKRPTLEEVMAPFHAELAKKMKGKKAPTDDELKEAARKIAAERALR